MLFYAPELALVKHVSMSIRCVFEPVKQDFTRQEGWS